jgi:penicillin-binding protein-related factor A (putative recombinase)
MTTNSELKGYKCLKKLFPDTFICKIPDFKQTGNMHGGLPDYLVISCGTTYWFEIKKTKSNKKLSITDFTSQQLVTFNKMLFNEALVYILIIIGKNTFIVNAELILSDFHLHDKDFLDIKTLERYDTEWLKKN